MPIYHFHLENSVGPSGDADGRQFLSDDDALKEGATAAGEVLMSELTEGQAFPKATVTIARDGIAIIVVRAAATIERLA